MHHQSVKRQFKKVVNFIDKLPGSYKSCDLRGSRLTCKVANKCLNVLERVEVFPICYCIALNCHRILSGTSFFPMRKVETNL